MAQSRLSFEERKFVCKCHAAEVLKRFQRQFHTDQPSTHLTIKQIKDRFEADGTVQNAQRQRSERSKSSSDADSQERALNMYLQPRTSLLKAACEVRILEKTDHCIFKRFKWKSYYTVADFENMRSQRQNFFETPPFPNQCDKFAFDLALRCASNRF
ncbi:hypothetical protein AVEN_109822-1 [Araneus ventricosus]|uniref:DUF4817 domain-containing protein n=1 Tax=Araneus ventricosus TaxID=182803 RepID=A0A4Y2GG65_ARAVE|nr:hypothetical protein AVEN_109822-1 [Araneus ventricosus]